MAEQQTTIIGRHTSHFTRVVRMMAIELGVPHEFEIVKNLMSLDSRDFGGHPSMKIPSLKCGDAVLFGTENICFRLKAMAGRTADRRIVLFRDLTSNDCLNAQEIVLHAMAAQVQIVLGIQVANLSPENFFFKKLQTGLEGALAWLDQNLAKTLSEMPSDTEVSLFEICLFSLVEHVRYRGTASLRSYKALEEFCRSQRDRPSVKLTAYPNHR